ncbi:MAG: SAM-dependent DNA methyltransferase [Neisseriaceae bacterium]|nr:SAM-dependent DNA methyltransferase [Neisseriaceae bacterium]
MLTPKQQRQAAKAFVSRWQEKKGYEKGETQAFWNMLLRDIFGVEKTEDLIEYEKTVQQVKSRNFIDAYIESTRVLIEQKSDKVDLTQKARQSDGSFLTPYEQAKRYGDELPLSAKPRYIIACNFSEFHIHDMERPQDAPQIVLLKDLPREYHRLSFITERYKPAHIQKEEQLSIDAGKIVGILYDALAKQYKDINDPATQQSLNKLCVRLVFCLYAENADLFHQRSAFYDYLQEFSPRETRQALIDLFTVFNTPENARGKLYLSEECLKFPYVNGGLFADQDIEIPQITEEIRNLLLEKASNGFNWAEISPTIFGAVFESTLNPETRRSGGMHYTSIENIHKVIDPLFLYDFRDELAEIKQLKQKSKIIERVDKFQDKLASSTFLDPAAGSGNFLTETYISLRKLENEALHFAYGEQMHLIDPIKVKIGQFYGIEINDFAVSVAQTALWIAEIQMKRETEEIFTDSQIEYLPLKSFAHFYEGNALRLDWNEVIPADKLSYIMGNPPFVGVNYMTDEQREDMDNIWADKRGKLDYVACWYKKAAEYMQNNPRLKTALVSTNSITQGEQATTLWQHLFEQFNIEIDFAHRTFRWDSESNDKVKVHCVIIGFSLSGSLKQAFNPACHCEPEQSSGVAIHSMTQSLSNADRRCNDTAQSHFRQPENINANAHNAYGVASTPNGVSVDCHDFATQNLAMTQEEKNLSGSLKKQKIIYNGNQQIIAKNINQYLLDAPTIFIENRSTPICEVPAIVRGSQATDNGYYLFTPEERQEFIAKEPQAEKYFKRFMMGKEFLNNIERYCLWIPEISPNELRSCPKILKRVEAVQQFRLDSKNTQTKLAAQTPCRFGQYRPPAKQFIAFAKVSSERRQYIPLGFLSDEVIPGDKLFTIPNATLYMFGVLHSSVHNAWMRAVAGRLKSDYSYSTTIVYNNFIWCNANEPQRQKIEQTAQAILDARAKFPDSSLADLYDERIMPVELRTAHKNNDQAVLAAYNLPKNITEEEIVAFLMQEYQKRTGT